MAYQFVCTFYGEYVPVIIVKIRVNFSVQNLKKKNSILKIIQLKRDLSTIHGDLPRVLITSPGTQGMSKNLLRPLP